MVGRVIKASAAEVRKAWTDSELTLDQACLLVGMGKDALQARAAAIGLPHRKTGRREVIRPHQERVFRLMWKAGVSAREIGTVFGCSYFAVVNTAARLQLEMRGAGYRPKMTPAAFEEALLAASMAANAAKEAVVRREAFK